LTLRVAAISMIAMVMFGVSSPPVYLQILSG